MATRIVVCMPRHRDPTTSAAVAVDECVDTPFISRRRNMQTGILLEEVLRLKSHLESAASVNRRCNVA